MVVVSLVSCSCPSPLPVLMQAFLIKYSGTQTTKTSSEEKGGSGKEGFRRKGKGQERTIGGCDQSTLYAVQEGYSLDKRINYTWFTQD